MQKKTDNLTVFLGLLCSVCVKDACKLLVKSTLSVNFIDILRADFAGADPKSAKKDRQLECLFGDLFV